MIWFHFSYRNIPSISTVNKPDFQILSLKVCRYKMIKSVKQLIFVSHLNFLSFWKAARAIKALGAHPFHFRDEKTVAYKDGVASFKLHSQFIPEIPCLLFFCCFLSLFPWFLHFIFVSWFLFPTDRISYWYCGEDVNHNTRRYKYVTLFTFPVSGVFFCVCEDLFFVYATS